MCQGKRMNKYPEGVREVVVYWLIGETMAVIAGMEVCT